MLKGKVTKMSSNYRYTRNWENAEKEIFEGVGEFNIPVIQPENYHSVDKWISFNKAKTASKTEGVGIHHFIDDYQFIREWTHIDQYVNLFKKFDFVMSPDFSTYADFPKALQIYNHYRKHWIGAYLQKRGVHIIPTISWSTPDSFEWCFDGEPKDSVVAVSSVGSLNVLDSFLEGYNAMLDALHPTKIIFYGQVPEQCRGNIIKVKSFSENLREMMVENGW